MGLFDKLFGKKPEPIVEIPKPVKEKKPRKPKAKKEEPIISDKEKANTEGLPYVNILKMEIDPYDINSGAFELDYNDKFVLNLIRAGYKMRDDDSDTIIVDRWFQTVCRNIALELYEQQQADPENRSQATDMRVVRAKDLGDGRTEVS
jgi:predicted restriction endonuclease